MVSSLLSLIVPGRDDYRRQAVLLYRVGFFRTAGVVARLSIERTIRQQGEALGMFTKYKSVSSVVKQLYRAGMLTKAERNRIILVLRGGNDCAHFRNAKPCKVRALLKLARRLPATFEVQS